MEVVRCDRLPQIITDAIGKHRLSQQTGLVLCTYGAPLDIICDVSIDAGPIDCFPHLCLHPFHPLVGSIEVIKGMVEEFWEDADAVFPSEEYQPLRTACPGCPRSAG